MFDNSDLLHLLENRALKEFEEALRNGIQSGQVDINVCYYKSPDHVTLLHIACKSKGCHEFVPVLLQNGADINKPSKDKFCRSAIHFAVENSNLETLKILLNNANCNVNTLSMQGYSALHYAVMNDDADSIKLLLHHPGIDVNVCSRTDQTPLHLALNSYRRNAIHELLNHPQVDLDARRDFSGQTCRELIEAKYSKFAFKISRISFSANESDNTLFSLLYKGDIQKFCEQVLITKPNSTDHDGRNTYLQYACHNGLVQAVEILLRAGVDPNQCCPNNQIKPIMIAAKRGHHTILNILLQNSRVSLEPDAMNTVINMLLIEILIAKENEPLRRNYLKCVKSFLTSRFFWEFGINHPIKEGNSLLHYAIKLNDENIVEDLLQDGMNLKLDINQQNNEGDTPLHCAVKANNEKILKALLVFGAEFESNEANFKLDINLRNTVGNTPLHCAIILNDEKMVKDLLQVGLNFKLDINQQNNEGDTPLHYAVKVSNEKILKALLGFGAKFKWNGANFRFDINQRNKEGNTPLHCAVELNIDKIVKDFLHSGINCKVGVSSPIQEDQEESTRIQPVLKAADEEIIKDLLCAGAYVGRKNYLQKVPLNSIPASVLEEYLDSCISTNGKHTRDKNFEIVLDYSMMIGSNPKLEESAEDEVDDDLTEMEILLTMVNTTELRKLIKHPVLMSFLNLKWYSISKYFYINLIFHVIFCLLHTAYIFHINGCWRDRNDTQMLNTSVNFSQGQDSSQQLLEDMNIHHVSIIVICLRYMLIVSCVMLFLWELYQCYKHPWRYVTSLENWLELSLICILLALLILNMDFEQRRQLSSAAIMLSWINLMFIIGRHPLSSTNVEMFKTVSISFLKFLAWYSVLILAFTLSFYILFKDDLQDNSKFFKHPALAIIKSIIMLTGEFEAGSFPLFPFDLKYGANYVLFILFVFFIAIVLFNLLNGLAISDTQAIRSDAELLGIVSLVKMILYAEDIATSDFFKPLSFLHRSQSPNPDSDNKILYVLPNINNFAFMKKERVSTFYERLRLDPRIVEKPLSMYHNKLQIDPHIVKDAVKILEKRNQQNMGVEERISEKISKCFSRMENVEKLINIKLETVDESLKKVMEILESK
ncbi:transient receptor potential cation channel subfamily A member 1-like [Planococcus citri]|uniref:transient receptor potential cation channel subfamily A member 1-like n=1 Tax=Planococcus citri TaxID=170843 RepID=UPI0031F82C6B